MDLQLAKEGAEVILAAKCVHKLDYEMAIGAHQDDIEVMCPMGIIAGYKKYDKGFVGVVATDGGGSPRCGYYKYYSYEEMVEERMKEQKEAAKIGDYAALALLKYTSAEAKSPEEKGIIEDLKKLILHFNPSIIYIHNLLDKHLTHVEIAKKSIEALRELPKDKRPKRLYGCEVWRGLDWLSDDEKVYFDLSGKTKLLRELLGVFRSQLATGKRYDRATEGRRFANATFTRSDIVNRQSMTAYAMDLTCLIEDDTLDIKEFALAQIERFKRQILL